MPTRTFTVATAVVGAAALATTGVTYASTPGSSQTALHAAPAPQPAAPPVLRAAPPIHRAAQAVRHAAPAAASVGGGTANKKRDEGRDHTERHGEGGHRDHGHERRDEGRIEFNERTFSAAPDGCVVAASGLGSNSFSIFNDSDKTVEVFRGFTCDNGGPVAVVGPHGDTFGVVTSTHREGFGEFGDYGGLDGSEGLEGLGGFEGHGGFFPDDAVVGSFRVIGHHDDW
jgi:hypothetical protein